MCWVIDAACLVSTNRYWREYIVHLQEGVRTLVGVPAVMVCSKLTVTGKQSPLLEGWRPSKEGLCCVIHTLATTPATAKESVNG
jgi:hypothetical protein